MSTDEQKRAAVAALRNRRATTDLSPTRLGRELAANFTEQPRLRSGASMLPPRTKLERRISAMRNGAEL